MHLVGTIGLFWLGFVLQTPVAEPRNPSKTFEEVRVALHKRDLDGMRALIDGGVDLNLRIPGEDRRTFLHVAVECSFEPGVELLLDSGAEPNRRLANGWTPLHLASSVANRRIVKLLALRGARLDATDDLGATALHYAAQFGHTEMVSILLQHSEPGLVPITDARGWTALMRAEVFGREECAELLRTHALRENSDQERDAEPSESKIDSPLYRLLGPDAVTRVAAPDPKVLERALKKNSSSNRPVFHMTYFPNNGMASARNTHHLICAVWSDGLYIVRSGYTDPERKQSLPPLAVGLLSSSEVDEFLAAAQETEFFSASLSGNFTYPCGGWTSASLLWGKKRLGSSDQARVGAVSVQWSSNQPLLWKPSLDQRIHRHSLLLLGSLLASVLDPASQPLSERSELLRIRGYNMRHPTRTSWW